MQEYTVTHYPEMPSKFGELLLRMPELSRVCQVSHIVKKTMTRTQISFENQSGLM